jgi:hypothetical protein
MGEFGRLGDLDLLVSHDFALLEGDEDDCVVERVLQVKEVKNCEIG